MDMHEVVLFMWIPMELTQYGSDFLPNYSFILFSPGRVISNYFMLYPAPPFNSFGVPVVS